MSLSDARAARNRRKSKRDTVVRPDSSCQANDININNLLATTVKPLYYLPMNELGNTPHRCEHAGCPHGARQEYCEVLGRDKDAEIGIVAEYLDTVLFSNLDLEGSGIVYSTDKENTYLQRNFNLLQSDNKLWVWPLIETNVMIGRKVTRNPECITYEIATSWQVHQPLGQEAAPYATTYTLELWADSSQATIREYDLTVMRAVDFPYTTLIRDRPMTPYDHEQLFDLLQGIESMQKGQAVEVELGIL